MRKCELEQSSKCITVKTCKPAQVVPEQEQWPNLTLDAVGLSNSTGKDFDVHGV